MPRPSKAAEVREEAFGCTKHTVETHESYGMVGISRSTGSHQNLFGSSIKHQNVFRLRICRAEKHRDLSRDWYFGRKELIEVELSPSQLVDLITCMNVGDGVPCTISAVNGDLMSECPEANARQEFVTEFKHQVQKTTRRCDELLKEITEKLSQPKLLKADRESLIGLANQLVSGVRSTLPFIQSQFNESMDDVVTQAKAEYEALVSARIQSLGLEGLHEEVKAVLESNASPPRIEDNQKDSPS